MNLRVITQLVACMLMVQVLAPQLHAEFFKIDSVNALSSPPKDGIAIWYDQQRQTNAQSDLQFQPSLVVNLRPQQDIAGKDVYVRCHFYDQAGKLMLSLPVPSRATQHDYATPLKGISIPTIIKSDGATRVFFQMPKGVTAAMCHAVVVFGDKDEASAVSFPLGLGISSFQFPEKKLAENHFIKDVKRKVAVDPLVQYEAKNVNTKAKVKQLTLFLRMPNEVSDPSELNGVLALCVLAGAVDEVKQKLQQEEMSGDYKGLFAYANKNKLALLVWASCKGGWDPSRNYDEMDRKEFLQMEETFNDLADTWDRGVSELVEKYHLPKGDFLVWGVCRAAQWAQRLCLRKPDRFLGCYMLIPGSFDKPTTEGSKVLWCLCTGEQYGGYERALAWYKECRALNYPMIFKAYEGLGHTSSASSLGMAFQFFDFALTQKDLRDQYDKLMGSRLGASRMQSSGQSLGPWPEAFRNPQFYGDIVNQEVYPSDQVEMIPAGFRTPLPTKALADYWLQGKK